MRFLGSFFIHAEVILTGCDQSLVSQNLLDVADGTTVEEHDSRARVAEYMRGYLFGEAGPTPDIPKSEADRVISDRLSAWLSKQALRFITPAVEVFLNPGKRAWRKVDHPFPIAFTDDLRLTGSDVD